MGFTCGIVGLPNVGKSTLFNALTETAAAQAANYPFCTIEPNVGEVAVPDPRLEPAGRASPSSAEIMPTRLTFVDIAGLVRGASKGEGLGNQFLANIREVDAIAHVVRCFDDGDVIHVEGEVDPIADIETIETELMLADLDSLEKRVEPLAKRARGGDKEAKRARSTLDRARARRCCATGTPARASSSAEAEEQKIVPHARAAHRQAGALRVQRRRGRAPRPATRYSARGRGARQGRGRRRGRRSRPRSRPRSRTLPADERTEFLERDRPRPSPASTG